MTPDAIVAMITAIAKAVEAGFLWAGTPAGQASIAKSLEDRAAFEKGIKDIGTWFAALVSGKLT